MAKKSKKHQSKNPDGGIVYSTNEQWNPFAELSALQSEQNDNQADENAYLHIHYEKKGRNGKPVTIVKGWPSDDDIREHSKALKQTCGVGGSVKDDAILLQGDQRSIVEDYASKKKMKTKRIGG
jgi:translation initiation factor 1